jgi:hypothetical protein
MFRLMRRRRYIALVAILLMQICAGAGWDNAVCRGAACQSDYPIGPLPTYVRHLAFAVVGCLAANFLLFWIQYSIILLHLPWTLAAFYFDRRLFTVRCLVAGLFPAVLFFVLAVVLFADDFPVTLVAIPPVFFAGDFWAVPVAFFPQSRADAMSAPARHDCSFAHTTSSVTHFPARERAEATIRTGNDAFPISDRGNRCLDALRDDLWVLDEIAFRVDHPRQQDHVVGQFVSVQRPRFVLTARIGEFDTESTDGGLVQNR